MVKARKKHILLRVLPPITGYIIASFWASLNMGRNDAMAVIPIFALLTMIVLILTGGTGEVPEDD